MFKPEDFELPLEKQLRMLVISKEIEECTSVEALQEHLKQCAESLMKYQHLLSVTLSKQIENDLNQMADKIVGEAMEMINGSPKQGDVQP